MCSRKRWTQLICYRVAVLEFRRINKEEQKCTYALNLPAKGLAPLLSVLERWQREEPTVGTTEPLCKDLTVSIKWGRTKEGKEASYKNLVFNKTFNIHVPEEELEGASRIEAGQTVKKRGSATKLVHFDVSYYCVPAVIDLLRDIIPREYREVDATQPWAGNRQYNANSAEAKKTRTEKGRKKINYKTNDRFAIADYMDVGKASPAVESSDDETDVEKQEREANVSSYSLMGEEANESTDIDTDADTEGVGDENDDDDDWDDDDEGDKRRGGHKRKCRPIDRTAVTAKKRLRFESAQKEEKKKRQMMMIKKKKEEEEEMERRKLAMKAKLKRAMKQKPKQKKQKKQKTKTTTKHNRRIVSDEDDDDDDDEEDEFAQFQAWRKRNKQQKQK
jgi:hypothetical protein